VRAPLIALATVIVSLAGTPAAGATKIAPPGNSGVSQYVENVPGAQGNVPTLTIHPHPAGAAGPANGAVAATTRQALAGQGVDGARAVALANAAAPPGVHGVNRRHRSGAGATSGGQGPGGGVGAAGGSTPVSGSVASPTSAVLKAVTGSATHGLGALLPGILVASAIGAGLLAALRRRRAT
jgi:hypothetical protein